MEDELASAIVRMICERWPDVQARAREPRTIAVSLPRGETMLIDISSIERSIRGLGDSERRAEIIGFLDSFFRAELPEEPFASAAGRLFLQLASADKLGAQSGMAEVLRQPFCQSASIVYALREEGRFSYVDQAQLAQWGVTLADVHRAALENLAESAREFDVDPRGDPDGPRFVVIASDSFMAARSQVQDFMLRIEAELGAGMRIGIPNLDILVAWSAHHPRDGAFRVRIRQDFDEKPYPLTSEIFVCDNGVIRPEASAAG